MKNSAWRILDRFRLGNYLQQYGTSFFSLWYLTQVVQSLWRGQSFFGHGQLGADMKWLTLTTSYLMI